MTMVEVGKRYKFRIKNPGGKTLSFYEGDVQEIDGNEAKINDKFGKTVIINLKEKITAEEI